MARRQRDGDRHRADKVVATIPVGQRPWNMR